MNIKLLASGVTERLVASRAGPALKSLVEIIERRPGLQLHVIAGLPTGADPSRPSAALAFVVADGDDTPWGLSIVELTDPPEIRLAASIGVVECVAASGVVLLNRALISLRNDPIGKSYDFSVADEEG